MSEKMIEVQGVTKSFGDLLVLKGIDLVIYKGEVVSIGTHEELYNNVQMYRDIVDLQKLEEQVHEVN